MFDTALSAVTGARYTYYFFDLLEKLRAVGDASIANSETIWKAKAGERSNAKYVVIGFTAACTAASLLFVFSIAAPLTTLLGLKSQTVGSGGSSQSLEVKEHVQLLLRARIALLGIALLAVAALVVSIWAPLSLPALFHNMNLASRRDYALSSSFLDSQEFAAGVSSPFYYQSLPLTKLKKSNDLLVDVNEKLYFGSSLQDGEFNTFGQDSTFDYFLFGTTKLSQWSSLASLFKEEQCQDTPVVETQLPIEGPFGYSPNPLEEAQWRWQLVTEELSENGNRSTTTSEQTEIEHIASTLFRSLEISTAAYGDFIVARQRSLVTILSILLGVLIAAVVVVSFTVFLPMVVSLIEDEKSTWHLIGMIPQTVREKVPAIADFVETGRADSAAELQRKIEQSENLLKNILPTKIANRLKSGEQPIADMHLAVTMCFTDLVGFTSISSTMNADQIVSFLNELFVEFDTIAELFEVEKVKTIGDAYFMVGGLDKKITDHALRVVEASLCFFESLEEHNERHPDRKALRMRLGVHTGPAVAGVIGTKKVAYDLWGRSVEIANAMESTGVPGKVHISEPTLNEVRRFFHVDPRGTLPTEKGTPDNMPTTYLVAGRNMASPYQHVRRPRMNRHLAATAHGGPTAVSSGATAVLQSRTKGSKSK